MRSSPSLFPLFSVLLVAIAAVILAPYAVDAIAQPTTSTNPNAFVAATITDECYWLPSSYGDCDVTCGSGIRTRSVDCYCGETLESDSSCADLATKPDTTTGCTLECYTYEWSTSSWSGCEALGCGSAYNSRTVECVTSSGTSIESSYCDGSSPSENAVCTSDNSCASMTNATWNWGEWTSCTASCGAGHETRNRYCIGLTGGVVDDVNCDEYGLDTYRTCNLGDCETFSWSITSWSDCSVTCGTGYSERTATCLSSARGAVDDSECDAVLSYSKPSEIVRCEAASSCPTFEWVGQGFNNSECSVTCGDGQKTQEVLCINSLTSESVDTVYCTGSFPVTVESCYAGSCVTCEWSTTSFSFCSTTCGLGEQVREVTCACSDSSIDYSLTLCNGTMPALVESCDNYCPVCFYVPGAYGECSATCGDSGTMTRDIDCVCDGTTADASYCSGLDNTFETSTSCNVKTCPTYSWVSGNWSDCSVTCGSGWYTRDVTCVDQDGVEVESTYCDGSEPATSEACEAALTCDTAHWRTGEPTCSASCGSGYTTRLVWCELYGQVVADSNCDGTMPDATGTCYKGPCETYGWSEGDWSNCTATCNGGVAIRTVTCVSNTRGVVENYHCDADTEPDAIESCNSDIVCPSYAWASLGWSNCSTDCGAGTQTLSVACEEVHTGESVDSSYCNASTIFNTIQVCSSQACEEYEWHSSNWTDCSVSCGQGVATRTVICLGKFYGLVDVTGQLCSGTRPSESADCEADSCPTYKWQVSTYGDCSASVCGDGVQTRTVWCEESTGSVVSSDLCTGTAPDSSQTCSYKPCQSDSYTSSYNYTIGTWGTCDVTCGTGTQVRTVLCYLTETTVDNGNTTVVVTEVEAAYCEDLTTPDSTETCDSGVKCSGYGWRVGTPGECSASCGTGYTTSTAYCYDYVYDVIVDDSFCDGTKPDTTADCTSGPCETYGWTVGDYGNCSASCGTGIATRSVYCVSSQRGYVASSHCTGTAPVDHEACSADVDCVTCEWTRGSWSDCSATCGLGEVTRTVTCECSDGSTSDTGCANTTAWTTSETCSYGGACETYSWVTSNYTSECSASCGEGVLTRTVECVGSTSGTVDTTGIQCSLSTEPVSVIACTELDCETFKWEYNTSWSDCSVTCGFGSQTTTKVCIGNYGTIDDTGLECANLTSSATSRDCFPTTCEVCTWQVGSLSDCSVTCGDGVETREVACVGNRGTVCDDSECADYDAPNATLTCTMAACTTYSWYIGAYSDCSVTCGTGTKTRDAFCHDNEGLVVDASYCDGTAPEVDTTCDTGVTCTNSSFTNGEWSDCSASCGAGTRVREVYCVAVDGTVLDDSACSGDAPATSEDCNLCSCETTEWEVTSWSECSVTCGTGFETRSIECRSTLRGYVGSSECSGTEVTDHQPCTIVCYSWQAGDWGTCVDNVHTRNVYCVGTDGSLDSTGDLCTGTQLVDSDVCS